MLSKQFLNPWTTELEPFIALTSVREDIVMMSKGHEKKGLFLPRVNHPVISVVEGLFYEET